MGSKDVILQLTVCALLTLQVWADQSHVNHPVQDVVDKLDELRREIASIMTTVDTLDDNIQMVINPEDCSVGINNPYCSLANVDDLLHKQTILSSHTLPGKRSKRHTAETQRMNRVIDDLSRKQTFLRALKKMLSKADATIQNEKKRSCNFNLGFHCQTDEYSNIADMYDFLNSEMSPGKRRRRSPFIANKQH